MATLSEIINQLDKILDQLQDESESPETQESDSIVKLLQQLETCEELRNKKIDAIVFMIQEFQAMAEAKKAIADKYKQQSTTWKNKAKSLKQYLQYWVSDHPDKVINTGKHVLKLVNNSIPSLIISGEVPTQYCKTIIESDDDLIRQALKDGAELDFARLERGVHLGIK